MYRVYLLCDALCRGKEFLNWCFTLWRPPETDLHVYVLNSSERISCVTVCFLHYRKWKSLYYSLRVKCSELAVGLRFFSCEIYVVKHKVQSALKSMVALGRLLYRGPQETSHKCCTFRFFHSNSYKDESYRAQISEFIFVWSLRTPSYNISWKMDWQRRFNSIAT